MIQATIVLKEEPYFLVDHRSRVLQDIYIHIYMLASGEDSTTFISVYDVNQTSSVVGIPFWRGVRLCPLKFPCALLVFKHVMRSYVIV